MIQIIKNSLYILGLLTFAVACSHTQAPERSVAGQSTPSCWDSVKGNYHSYFDSVEKCIEKQADK